MNDVHCEIVKDLLPLYCDGVCSEESRGLIRSHVGSCSKCAEELRLMDGAANLEGAAIEIDAVQSASRAWKKNRRTAFRRGIGAALALVLLLGSLCMGGFLGKHYRYSCADGDWEGLREVLAECNEEKTLSPVVLSARKGGYLAIACSDGKGLWHVGIFKPDSVFSQRWVNIGSLVKVRPGRLANWNHQINGVDTVLICFGAELPEEITGYTFTNSGVTYTCPVKDCSFLDFFFIPDTYDSRTILKPIGKS